MSAKLLPFPSRTFPAVAPVADPVVATPDPLKPLHQLRAMVEAGEEMLPTENERLQCILQKLAAGAVECVLLSRLPTLHTVFPDPSQALGRHRNLCRQIAGVTDAEIGRAGPLLFVAILSAAGEAKASLGKTFDAEAWAAVLTQVLKPQRPPAGAACEVHDIATLRLIRLARRGAFASASFAADDGDDVA